MVNAKNAPIFISVVHKFNEGKAETWWAGITAVLGDAEKMAAGAAEQKELGYVNHYFMPSTTGQINCLWECRDEVAAAAFQSFIDGPKGPGAMGGVPDAFVNDCYRAVPGAAVPASAFSDDAAPAEKKQSSGAFWWVYHEFKDGAAESWWGTMSKVMGDPEAMKAMTAKHIECGFFNHSFVPAGGDKPMVCIWEAKADVSAEDFQAFIDGPNGPGGGALVNTCFKVAPGANVPSAYFAKA